MGGNQLTPSALPKGLILFWPGQFTASGGTARTSFRWVAEGLGHCTLLRVCSSLHQAHPGQGLQDGVCSGGGQSAWLHGSYGV